MQYSVGNVPRGQWGVHVVVYIAPTTVRSPEMTLGFRYFLFLALYHLLIISAKTFLWMRRSSVEDYSCATFSADMTLYLPSGCLCILSKKHHKSTDVTERNLYKQLLKLIPMSRLENCRPLFEILATCEATCQTDSNTVAPVRTHCTWSL